MRLTRRRSIVSCARRAAAAIEHDHIIAIFHVGEHDGTPYLTMPLLKGETLLDRLKREKSLPLALVARIGREIAEGLAAAHENGLIHRDIKPANLWLEGKKGRIKILDFGLARSGTVAPDGPITQTGVAMGTPSYMSPEQARGKDVDHRTDLFSLGCVLYQLTTGQLPFKGSDVMAILTALAVDAPRSPVEINAQVPPALNDLILKLLEKKPEQRPESATATAHALEAIETQLGGGSGPQSSSDGDKTQPAAVSKPPERAAPPRRRRGWLVGMAAALVLAIGGYYASQVIIRIKSPDGKETEITVPDGSKVAVGPDGKVNVTLPDPKKKEDAKPLVKVVERKPSAVIEPEPLTVREGWPLTPVAQVRRPTPIKEAISWDIVPRNTTGIQCNVAFNARGDLLAAGSDDGVTRIYNPENGHLVRALVGHTEKVYALAWSPCGFYLATAGKDRRTFFWEIATGRLLKTIANESTVRSLGWSHDGRFLAISGESRKATVWDIAAGKVSRAWIASGNENENAIIFVGWEPENAALLTADYFGEEAVLWDNSSGKRIGSLPLPKGAHAVSWRAKSRRVAISGQHGFVEIWEPNADGFKRVFQVQGPKGNPAIVALSPDGTRIVCGFDGLAEIHDVVNKKRLHELRAGKGYRFVDWSPDGKTVATASQDGVLGVWNAETGRLLRFISSPYSVEIGDIALSPDGRLLAGQFHHEARVWDASTGQLLASLAGHDGRIHGFAWSFDGTLLATASDDHSIRVWEPRSGKEMRTLLGHVGPVARVAWSKDGKHIASASTDKTVRLWDAANGMEIHKLLGHDSQPYNVSFSHDGRFLASCGPDRSLIVWNTDTGKEVKKWVASCALNCVEWSPDDNQLVVGGNGRLLYWDVTAAKVIDESDGVGNVRAVAWSPTGRYLAANIEGSIRIRDLKRARTHVDIPRGPGDTSWGLSWSQDGTTLIASGPGTISFFDPEDGRLRGTLLPTDGESYLVVSPDGHYRGSPHAERHFVYVVQTEKGQETLSAKEFATKFGWKNDPAKVQLSAKPPAEPIVFTRPELALPKPGDPVSPVALVARPTPLKGVRSWTIETREPRIRHQAVALSPDGLTLAVGNADGTVHLLKASNRKLLRILVGHGDRVHAVCWSPDNKRLATHDGSGQARIWDAATGRTLGAIRFPFWDSWSVGQLMAWSPDGAILAAGTQSGEIRLYDGNSYQEIDRLHGHRGMIRSLGWSVDSRLLATADAKDEVRIWDVQEGQPLQHFSGQAVAWSPDGKRFATGGADKKVRVWDSETWKLLHTYDDHQAGVTALAWSPDGKLLAIGSEPVDGGGFVVKIRDVSGNRVVNELTTPGWSWVRNLIWLGRQDRLLVCLTGHHNGQGASVSKAIQVQWNLRTDDARDVFENRSCVSLTPFVWDRMGTALSLAAGDTIHVWKEDKKSEWKTLGKPDSGWIQQLLLSKDGQSLTALGSEKITTFEMATGKSAHKALIRDPKWAWTTVCSPDGALIATVESANTIVIRKIGEAKPIHTLTGHKDHINHLAWSPDGKSLASISHDESVRIWELTKGSCTEVLADNRNRGDSNHWRSVYWSQDGKVVAAAVYDHILTWDVASGRQSNTYFLDTSWTFAAAFSPDGTYLIGAGLDMRTKVWNTRTGQLARTFHHTQATNTASWSPDGKTLAVTGHEDILRFWDGETFEARGVLMKFRNGKHLAIGATGHYVGSPGIEHEIVYVVVTDAGQEMLTPEEFAGRFGWTNDPSKVKLFSSAR